MTTDDFAKLSHDNYHTWAPRMTAELQRLGIWRMCTGDEKVPACYPVLSVPESATVSERIALQRNYQDEV
jgi:hypothetical protein